MLELKGNNLTPSTQLIEVSRLPREEVCVCESLPYHSAGYVMYLGMYVDEHIYVWRMQVIYLLLFPVHTYTPYLLPRTLL